ncbi:methyl-accepting chemotaxis protein [Roseomonas xinghualingensis]|uniref:methyl-accepting chemotaxis protein n=1 Tax=Roseomonas xinghualingensis TaxID=2986475 RepID=UPI0021F2196C|nr:methyl-accepting chemotaxis protein [Roseomonas sp. SXEYE001]MCV4208788.1 methyl-accepting chemotaxis protein [Roseomonas sp. SXEYE001]
MSITNRALLGFVTLTLLCIALGLWSLNQFETVRDAGRIVATRDLTVMRQVSEMRDAQTEMRDTRARIIVSHLGRRSAASGTAPLNVQAADWQRANARMITLLNETITSAQSYSAQAIAPERREAWQRAITLLNGITAIATRHRDRVEAQLRAAEADDAAAVMAAEPTVAVSTAELDEAVDRTEVALENLASVGQQRVEVIAREARTLILFGMGVAVLLAILVSYLIRQAIARPLEALMEFVQRIGRGELGGNPAREGRDEFGRLGETLNTMVAGLRDLARQSRDATQQLDAATAEIRASTQEQAASVEEQLAAVQETAATVDEITHSGAQIGKRAQEVIAAAQATVRTSDNGLRSVEETVRAMDGIREQAERVAENIVALSEKTQAIGEITTTVNDISERSHLLALNAAIEAAAAGEAGRSFSVVAAEMKSLADQAKEATNQVRAILGDIQRGINSSVMLTEEAVKRALTGRERTATSHETIREITARVQEAVQTFQQIVASTNQQQLGIEQVMSALTNIRQASQQTAAGTRQLDQAAANMAGLSQGLVRLSERYRL